MAANPDAQKLAELAALVDSVKQRVRAQYPETTPTDRYICVGLPDLQPLARARDAAVGKMAAIGTVNPRQGGVVNNAIQAIKRTVARSLNWFVRDQVVFNRQMIACVETAIETLGDVNRTIHLLAQQTNHHLDHLRAEAVPLREEAQALRRETTALQDLGSHWNVWREQWQLKLHKNEVEFLKSVAELHQQHEREVVLLDEAYRKTATGLEGNCQRAAELIETRFRDSVAQLDTRYRATAAQLEAGFRETVVRVEDSSRVTIAETGKSFELKLAELTGALERHREAFAVSMQKQHDSFEALANGNAEAIQRSTTEQIAALAEERREWSVAMNQRLDEQAAAFDGLLGSSIASLQTKFYADLDRIRTEYERIIHAELRVVRQRLGGFAPAPASTTPAAPETSVGFDYARFAGRFRGSEEYVAESQKFYLPYFAGRRHVLDLGCGRGEFLRMMREAGVPARGIEASEESVAYCRGLGLDAENADLFAYLENQPEGSLDGIFCSQVVEHLPPARLPEMIRACATRLATGGVLAIETPNPECLAIFATHFYLDPTHTRPIPAQLLAFYMEEAGLGRVEIHAKSPAVESMPEVGDLPAGFRGKFFGGLDYAIVAYKL